MAYKVVYFDLDHTLWDYHRNADETLTEIFSEYLPSVSGDLNNAILVFKEINNELWSRYHRGEIRQSEIRTGRFHQFLERLEISDRELAEHISQEYIRRGPAKNHLIPHTLQILDYLKPNYAMMIITNGFEETQRKKVRHAGLDHYFREVLTSEKAGTQKPSPEIFHRALSMTDHRPEEAIMIGDNLETDIQGAKNAGIDSVFFNPERLEGSGKATYTIHNLMELKSLL